MSGWTWFLSRTRFLIVEEMHLSDRKDTMNRLKPLIASPPYTLPVNVKHQPQYEVPNLVASIFFTNNSNALAVSAEDRRFFVAWNESPPRDPEYYAALVAWYESGGAAIAARWLLQRDLTDFRPKGKAPPSSAKEAMRKASRFAWEAVVEDAANDGDGPFSCRVVALDEIEGWVRQELGDRGRMNRPLANLLKRVGFVELRRCELGPRPDRLGGGPSGGPRLRRLYVRRDDALANGQPDLGRSVRPTGKIVKRPSESSSAEGAFHADALPSELARAHEYGNGQCLRFPQRERISGSRSAERGAAR